MMMPYNFTLLTCIGSQEGFHASDRPKQHRSRKRARREEESEYLNILRTPNTIEERGRIAGGHTGKRRPREPRTGRQRLCKAFRDPSARRFSNSIPPPNVRLRLPEDLRDYGTKGARNKQHILSGTIGDIRSLLRSPHFERVKCRVQQFCSRCLCITFSMRGTSSGYRSTATPRSIRDDGTTPPQPAVAHSSTLFDSTIDDRREFVQENSSDCPSILLGRSLEDVGSVESGVNFEMVQKIKDNNAENMVPIIRKDPFQCLPTELIAAILSNLDTLSLARAERVSTTWYRHARQSHAWMNVFHNETQKERQHMLVRPGQFQISGGGGFGNSSPNQEYKLMLRARQELQKRWKEGKAVAIYLEGHTDSVYCVQFDEEKIITGSRDRTIRIWDSRSYRCLKILGAPNRSNTISRLPVQTDGLGQPGRPTKILPFPSHVLPSATILDMHHLGSVLCLQYDEEILVSGSSDSTCIVWDIKKDYQPLRNLRGHTAGILDVCFDEKHIVSCSKDTTICLWNRRTGTEIRRMTGHRGPVNAVQLRGNLIASASGDGIAKLWNLTSGLCIKEFRSKDRGMACVDFSLDSRTVLAGGNDKVVYQFDTNSGQTVRELTGHQDLVRSLYLDNTNGRIISGSYDTSIRAYDFLTGNLILAFVQWTTSWILSAKSDYRRIVAASQDSRVVIMDFGYDVPHVELLAA